MLYNI